MSHLIFHIESSLKNANNCASNLSKEVLDIEGMSGYKTRHFYNNICSIKDAVYLEIGCFKGSSLCAAMYKNSMSCVAIDNWTLWEGPKDEFLENYNKFKGINNCKFIEQDCWTIECSELPKFNIYMYDGHHSEDSHYKAINHFYDCLQDKFIYLVDDWNWQEVRSGTINSIKDNNLNILYKKEIFTENDPGREGKFSEWHNGIGIFVLEKKYKYEK
mgnify:CR=1 FL=1